MSLDLMEHVVAAPNGEQSLMQADLEKPLTKAAERVKLNGVNEAVKATSLNYDNNAEVRDEVLWKPHQRIRVISIGAGFSGLTLANKIQRTHKLDAVIEHIIYEKNPDIGGTWYENRYPGVMCDVPAHIYTFLDIPHPDWSHYYATGPEIHQYLKKVTKEYNLDRDVQLNSEVKSAIWDEGSGQWKVQVLKNGHLHDDWCHVLINGSGVLNHWSWPKIPGLKSFKGHLCHSANWQDGFDFSGKRVAVVGNGSSGIQIVPEMQKIAGSVVNFIRSKAWISAPFAEDFSKSPGGNPAYTEEEKQAFRDNPDKLQHLRQKLVHVQNTFYEALIEGAPTNLEAAKGMKALMEDRLGGNPELIEKLVPNWSLGCRRLTPGTGYLESLNQPNAELVNDDILELTANGVRTADGKHRDFDAIVMATGFDVSFRPRWTQLGRNGRSLQEDWKDEPSSYFSLAASGQPNHFIFMGPAGPVGHGSLTSAIDWTADYILKWILKMTKEDIKSFEVKDNVQRDWNTWGDELMKRTVWSSGCR
jgi:cation diffusion facilitator CzcD-associated flavoprotein CzcO